MKNDVAVIPIMGPPACAMIEPGDSSVVVEFDCNRSYALSHDLSNWEWPSNESGIDMVTWWFEGGSCVYGTDENSWHPYVEYDTPGQYKVSLTCRAQNGTEYTAYRDVFIFYHPLHATTGNRPIEDIEVDSLSGSQDSHSWAADVRVYGEQSTLENIPSNALVVLFAELWYGGTQVAEIFPYSYPGRQNIRMVGWVQESSVAEVGEDSGAFVANLRIVGLGEALQQYDSYPVYFTQIKEDAPDWALITLLPLRRLWWLLVHWHWTLIRFTDFYVDPTDAVQVTGHNFPDSGLGDQITSLCQYTQSNWGTDRNGGLYIYPEPYQRDRSERNAFSNYVIDLDTADIVNIDITKSNNKACQVLAEGIYSRVDLDSDDPYTAYAARIPPEGRAWVGTKIELLKQVIRDETHAERLARLLYAWYSRSIDSVQLTFSGDYRAFDIAPAACIALTYTPTDVPRGINWTSKIFWVVSISEEIDLDAGTITTTAVLVPDIQPAGESDVDVTDIEMPGEGDIPDSPGKEIADLIEEIVDSKINEWENDRCMALMGRKLASGHIQIDPTGYRLPSAYTVVRLFGDDNLVVIAQNKVGIKQVYGRLVQVRRHSLGRGRWDYFIDEAAVSPSFGDQVIYQDPTWRSVDGLIEDVDADPIVGIYSNEDLNAEATAEQIPYTTLQAVFTVPETISVADDVAPSLFIGEENLYLRQIHIYLRTAPVGADAIFDIKLNGETIFDPATTLPTIPDGENTYLSPVIVSPLPLAVGSRLDVDIKQVGTTTPGADLTVSLRCRQYGH